MINFIICEVNNYVRKIYESIIWNAPRLSEEHSFFEPSYLSHQELRHMRKVKTLNVTIKSVLLCLKYDNIQHESTQAREEGTRWFWLKWQKAATAM